MDNRTNLDDYLAGLGISDADESALPPPAPDAAPVSAPLPGADEDPRAVLEQFLAELTARIDPGLRVQVRETGDSLEAEISGENAARLAGRVGRSLGAIEIIA